MAGISAVLYSIFLRKTKQRFSHPLPQKKILPCHGSVQFIICNICSILFSFVNYLIILFLTCNLNNDSTGMWSSSCCRTSKLFFSIPLQVYDKFSHWSREKEVQSICCLQSFSPFRSFYFLYIFSLMDTAYMGFQLLDEVQKMFHRRFFHICVRVWVVV